jgi:hypothetical protein
LVVALAGFEPAVSPYVNSMALNALPYFVIHISVHPLTLSITASSHDGIIHALHGIYIYRSFSF